MTGTFIHLKGEIMASFRDFFLNIKRIPDLLQETNVHLTAISSKLDELTKENSADLKEDLINIKKSLSNISANHLPLNSPGALLQEVKKVAMRDSVDIVTQEMPGALLFHDGVKFHQYCVDQAKLTGAFCEFGVYSGTSINCFAEHRPEIFFDGFDSFEGLPEEWSGNMLVDFNKGKEPPAVRNNVRLHVGWFNETLPLYAKTVTDVSFIHVDCDIYSSTVTIFENLGSKLRKGSVILFDEYFIFPGFKLHERKAFEEYLLKTDLRPKWFAVCGPRAACILE